MDQLEADGFVIVPGPVAGNDLGAVVAAYDAAFRQADVAELKAGSTSIRLNGFVNASPCFDPIYVYEPLLAAAAQVIGAPFKLSAFHARTV